MIMLIVTDTTGSEDIILIYLDGEKVFQGDRYHSQPAGVIEGIVSTLHHLKIKFEIEEQLINQ